MFKQNRTRDFVKRLLDNDQVHLEPMRGTLAQVLNYVHKEKTSIGNRFTLGEKPKQGNESKWNRLKAAIDSGTTTIDLWIGEDTSATMAHYFKQEQRYRLAKAQVSKPHVPRAILYIWGPTGCGKSTLALDYVRGEGYVEVAVPAEGGTLWCHEETTGALTVMMHELQPRMGISRNQMLRLLDAQPFQVQTKGGHALWDPRKVIFTSNFPPEALFDADEAWLRRLRDFGKVIDMTNMPPYVSPFNQPKPNLDEMFPTIPVLQQRLEQHQQQQEQHDAEIVDLTLESSVSRQKKNNVDETEDDEDVDAINLDDTDNEEDDDVDDAEDDEDRDFIEDNVDDDDDVDDKKPRQPSKLKRTFSMHKINEDETDEVWPHQFNHHVDHYLMRDHIIWYCAKCDDMVYNTER